MNKKFLAPIAAVLAVSFFLLPSGGAEAKNFRNRKSFSVTGDGSNADASIVYVGGVSTSTDHYRKVSFSGLKMANPFSYTAYRQIDPTSGFGNDAWSFDDHYFMTDGNLWFYYGDSTTMDGTTTYHDYSVGNKRYFQYYGGTKKKKRKNSAYKTYEVNVTGTENDADATSQEGTEPAYYYRRVSVPELNTANLVDYGIFSKNDFPQGFSDESWMLENSNYFLADGFLYIAYGYKYGSNFYRFDDGGTIFRFFTYSDGKRKKGRLKKQYVKKYSFSVPNDPNAADKVLSSDDGDGSFYYEYYKKIRIKGAKTEDFPNIQVIRKNSFASGYANESWSHRDFAITDGYLWVYYGYKDVDENGVGEYKDSGSGDYRAFLYR